MKKILTLVAALSLVASLAVGGSIAYLQDTAKEVNVMTLGNVDIEMHEYERELDEKGNYKTDTIDNQTSYVLTDFTQAKPLLPIVGDPSLPGNDAGYAGWDKSATVRMSQVDSYGGMDVFAGKNAQDKFVTVENTGRTDAYVRTIVAIEIGSADMDLIGTSYHQTWAKTEPVKVTIDGNNYAVIAYTYKGATLDDGTVRHGNGVLPAGDTTYPNLSQIYLKAKATNEDCEKIDGNGNGTLDILVLSQAIQADGFADAATALKAGFGDVTADKVAEWFAGTNIPTMPFANTEKELRDILANGGSVSLGKDIELDSVLEIPAGKAVTINLGGKTLSFSSEEAKASSAITNKGELTLTNGTITYEGVGDPSFGYGTNTVNNSGKLIIDGATIINTTNSGSSVAIDNAAGADLTIKSGVIKSMKNAIRLCPFGNAAINCTVDGGTIEGARGIQIQLPSNKPESAPEINLTINGGTLSSINGGLSLYSYSAGQSFENVNVTLNGGTYKNDVAFGGGNAKTTQENVTVTGGTFHGYLGRYVTDDGTNDGWEDIAKPTTTNP